MIYFAYHPSTRPTGRKLADALGLRHRGTFLRRNGRVALTEVPDFLVRWGNARSVDAPVTLNRSQAILTAGDKLRAIEALRQNNVLVPDGSTVCPGNGVVFARSRRGFGGTDIHVCGHDPCVRAEWFSTFIPNRREYRVHVADGKIIRVQRKYLERPELKHSEYIKNHANGYVFKAPVRRLNTDRHEAAINAVAALGLDFGAVDLVIAEDNRPYVLEVNTAPGCSPKTLNAYAQAIGQMVNERSNGEYIVHPAVDITAQLGDDE